jgi:hypothetical protein
MKPHKHSPSWLKANWPNDKTKQELRKRTKRKKETMNKIYTQYSSPLEMLLFVLSEATKEESRGRRERENV